MHYVTTTLTHYRYDGVHRDQTVRINFYKLLRSSDMMEATFLSYDETTELIQFLVRRPENFGDKNYHRCQAGSLVSLALGADEPTVELAIPKYLILKQDPQLIHHPGKILPAMEIELLNTLGKKNNPSYTLPFDVVAEITDQA